MNRSRAWAAGLGFVGLVLILSPWTSHPDSLSTFYAIGAGVDWGLAVVIAKKIPLRGTWELLSLNAWQSLLGGIPLAIIAFAWPGPPIRWTPIFDLALAYNIVLATSLAWFLWLFVLSRLSASQSGLSSLIVPVFGIVAAWIQLGERPGPWESAGVIAIVAGLAALAWSARRSATVEAN